MKQTKKWENEIDNELLQHVEKMKMDGSDIRYACQIFSSKHQFLTAEKCRMHYYQMIDAININNENENLEWSEDETKMVYEKIENRQGKKRIDIARNISAELKRTPRSILAQYYRYRESCKFSKIDRLINLICSKFPDSDCEVTKISNQKSTQSFIVKIRFSDSNPEIVLKGEYVVK